MAIIQIIIVSRKLTPLYNPLVGDAGRVGGGGRTRRDKAVICHRGVSGSGRESRHCGPSGAGKYSMLRPLGHA